MVKSRHICGSLRKGGGVGGGQYQLRHFVIVCYRHVCYVCVIVVCSYTYVAYCLSVAYRFHFWWCDYCSDYYSYNGGSYLHA